MENLTKLVKELCSLPNESEWLEFKHNNYDGDMIGRDISALANSAALLGRNYAYMLWGIDDKTHEIVGTKIDSLQSLKVGKSGKTDGQQELESWLRNLLSDNADFTFDTILIDGKNVCILTVLHATHLPVTFKKEGFIRIGSYTKKLQDFREHEARLWEKLRSELFEAQIAKKNLELAPALQLLEHSVYFNRKQIPQPSDITGVEHYFVKDGLLLKQDNGLYSITNLGAILFAKNLDDFQRLSRKALRVIEYEDIGHTKIKRQKLCNKGYAVGFEEFYSVVDALLPSSEPIVGAVRTTIRAFPPDAVREIIANAVIHQDFSLRGTGPLVEIFPNRIEVTNPGSPLIDIARIIDTPAISRNEKLARLMRSLGFCEEAGSGWDRIVGLCEENQLPAPKITLHDEGTRVILFSEVPFSGIAKEDRLRACYFHACLKHSRREALTNKSLRDRFGSTVSSGTVSKLIKDAIDTNLIKPLNPNTAPKLRQYVPIWA